MPAAAGGQAKSLNQKDYKGTAYADQAWEIVGEFFERNEFVPMEISVLPGRTVTTDPMFQDFGGLSKEANPKRMHVPEHLAQSMGVKAKAVDPDAGKIKMLPQELEALKKKAYDEGVLQGSSRGQEEGTAKMLAMQKGLQTVIQDLAQQLNQNLRGLEKNAVELALSIAERVIGYAVEISPDYIGHLVHEALTHAGSAVVKRVRVSPQDMEFITVVGIPKQLLDLEQQWSFEKDESIKAGCVVETSAGEIDFRVEQAWDRIKDNIVKILREELRK